MAVNYMYLKILKHTWCVNSSIVIYLDSIIYCKSNVKYTYHFHQLRNESYKTMLLYEDKIYIKRLTVGGQDRSI